MRWCLVGLRFSILCWILPVFNLSAQTHWQQLTVPANISSLSPYFVTPDYGFLYTSGITGWTGPFAPDPISPNGSQTDPPGIYRTLDGGITWRAMDIGEIANKSYALLGQMRFTSATHGYLAAIVLDTTTGYRGGLYETKDSGNHWNRISPNGFAFESLTLTDSLIFLVQFGQLGSIPEGIAIFNINNRSIREVPGAGPSITGNGHSTIYSHHRDQNSSPNGLTMRSSDGGTTWTTSEMGTKALESWSVYSKEGSNIILRVAEILPDAPLSEIQRSTDGGLTWNSVYESIAELAIGDIDGSDCAIYAHETRLAGPDSGILRSTDLGLTWQKVGGPIHRCDSRSLSVVGNGGVVYAVDDGDWYNSKSGAVLFTKLWRTTDGGDGAFEAVHPANIAQSALPSIRGCENAAMLFRLSYNVCLTDLSLDSIALQGDTIHFSLSSVPPLPTILTNGASDSFYVRFHPGKQVGKFTTTIHIRGSLPGGSSSYDTNITITATSTAPQPELATNTTSLDLGMVSLCLGRKDTSVVFTNSGCEPDTLTSVNTLGEGFSWLRDTLPIIIQPGDSIWLRFQFVPSDSGTFTATTKLIVTSMGLTETPQLALSGRGVHGTGILNVLSTSLQAGSFSFCAGDTTVFDTIRNTGCDTLLLSNGQLQGDPTFSLLTPLPPQLPPDSVAIISIHFSPRTKGAHAARLLFDSHSLHGGDTVRKTAIAVSGVGLPGEKFISASLASANFDSLYRCESRDTTITLYNTGCDTLIVFGDSLSNGAYSAAALFPIVIPPNGSSRVTVHLTADTNGMNGILSFASNSDTGAISIPMTASIIVPSHVHLSLSAADSAKARGMVTFDVLLTGNHSRLSGLHFDLTHNDDLLGYARGLSPASTSGPSTAQVQHFDLGPIPTGDTIGTLTFNVYLSDSTTTSLTLSNITFDNALGLAPDCIASIDDAGSGFRYIYSCSDHTLQQFLRTGTISTGGQNYPNPVNASTGFATTIPFTTSGNGMAYIRIMDMTGKEILSDRQEATYAGKHFFYFDADRLPSGSYRYSIEFPKGNIIQSRTMTVVR
ncbi:MAG: choice-of-anchor D domain-containing protein [Bacteroidota bacterium]|nr:choice-of-anchor D domain-containing protein [Bacteroidota bacterium]